MWWLKAKALSFKEFFDKIRTQMSTLTLVPAPAVGDLGKSIMHSGDSGSEVSAHVHRLLTFFSCA